MTWITNFDTVGKFGSERRGVKLAAMKPEMKDKAMSLKAEKLPEVPAETERVAKAVFPKGNVCMTMRDQIGVVYRDEDFQALFAERGRPAESAWRLALVSILQFMENLSDRQAAEAVRARIDWKYLLSLELEDTGFDYSILSEFRGRLVEGGAEQVLLDSLLSQLKERGLVKERGSGAPIRHMCWVLFGP
jgi:transposase